MRGKLRMSLAGKKTMEKYALLLETVEQKLTMQARKGLSREYV